MAQTGFLTTKLKVAALVSDPIEARRLIDWIPEAFGMDLDSRLGKPVLQKTFSAKDIQVTWQSFPLTCEPAFSTALTMAQAIFDDVPQTLHQNIAMRSLIANTANNALNAGVSIDVAVFSGPVLIAIPAEAYPKQPSIWGKLFSW